MGLFRRVTPAVFMGTAAVLVASNASTGAAALNADAPSEANNGSSQAQQTGPRELIERLWDDDHDDDYDDYDDYDDSYAPAPAPGVQTPTSPTTTSCAAAEVVGPTVRTQWGPVQVAAKVEGGRVCSVRVLQSPDGDRKSISINARAVPALNDQVIAVGDASFDGISGATVTSDGYRDSLQAILDQTP